MKLCLPVTHILASIAESEAASLGVPMAVALVDQEGGLLFFSRMDGALPAATEISISKAYTAAVLRMATEEVGRLACPGGVLYGIQHTHAGRIVLFGGGLPLRFKRQVVGGIGISGGSVDEDVRVAQPVVRALGEMERWCGRIKEYMREKASGEVSISGLESGLRQALEHLPDDISPIALSVLPGALHLVASEAQSPLPFP